jgi:diguanylate cyclase (GGDEF)-like protein
MKRSHQFWGVSWQNITGWITGNDTLPEMHRIFNVSCFIATLFCFLAGVQCLAASLDPILIANNFIYTLVLAVLYYLSRFKNKFGTSRFISIFALIFIYTPILWIYNGGSASGIPYFILMFSSFLTIQMVGKSEGNNKRALGVGIQILFSLIVTVLILLELFLPQIFYQYEDPGTRYFDIIISLLFALTSNYFILRAFVNLYYKQLDKIEEYSQKLEELVVRDSMTSIYNHGFVVKRLAEEIERAARYNMPLSVMMTDIDYFKKINDTYGHSFGDEVLIKLAQCIQSNCRNVDIVGRYGGEEFLILLPETNVNLAIALAKRLTETIRKIDYSNPIAVTISGGITGYQSGDTASMMIERADDLLYKAKNEGRNRVLS